MKQVQRASDHQIFNLFDLVTITGNTPVSIPAFGEREAIRCTFEQRRVAQGGRPDAKIPCPTNQHGRITHFTSHLDDGGNTIVFAAVYILNAQGQGKHVEYSVQPCDLELQDVNTTRI